MYHLTNKLLLFIWGTYLLFSYYAPALPLHIITTTVVSLALASLLSYFENTGILWGISVLYVILSLFFPSFGIYLSVFLYDGIAKKHYLRLIPFIATLLMTILNFPIGTLVPFLFSLLFAGVLSFYTTKLVSLTDRIHSLRDAHQATTLAYKERNQALIEKQNYSIHAATLAERNRIAREIHDNVGHMLTRSILQTGALKVINQDKNLDEPLATLHDTLNTAMTSIRTSVHDLHDEAIDLQDALQDIITPVDTLRTSFEYDVDSHLPKEMKYAFIAIVKEAVNNIQKHSNATSFRVCVREHPGFYLLQIEDNGTLSGPIKETGIGIDNMRERVTSLGGTFRISTEHGFGIYISIMKGDKKNESSNH